MKKLIISLIIWIFSIQWVWAFSDIENSWYKESILELKEQWVVNGFWDGSFGPDYKVTRAEILKIILWSSGHEVGDVDKDCFPDVDSNLWYSDYICYAAENGIANGYEDWKFRPNGEVSTLEVLAFASRAFDLDIRDKKSAEEWYDSYIEYFDENNIIPNYLYSLNNKSVRGQASEIIIRVQDLENGKDLDYESVWCWTSSSLSSNNSVIINGKTRSYLLDLPKNYNKNKAYSLVLGLHWRTNSNDMVRDYMWLEWGGWSKVEEQEVITAYPAGLWSGPYSWYQAENLDLVDAMISEINENLCVDRSSVHIVWHSMWAYFANRLACLRWDVISTSTAVAGGWYNGECRWPTASLILHNIDDPLDPYTSGTKARSIRLEDNTCNSSSKSTSFWPLKNCTIWSECSAGNPVVFCDWYSTYGNQPHSWPNQASQAVYDFIDEIR